MLAENGEAQTRLTAHDHLPTADEDPGAAKDVVKRTGLRLKHKISTGIWNAGDSVFFDLANEEEKPGRDRIDAWHHWLPDTSFQGLPSNSKTPEACSNFPLFRRG